jgi:hypothetical protein
MEDSYIPDVLDPPRKFDPPQAPSFTPSPPTSNTDVPDRRACVEEVEEEEDGGIKRWFKDYLRPAGTAGASAQTYFEKLLVEQRTRGQDPWAPFADEEEWGLAQWLMLNVGQNATDNFLKLPIVSNQNINWNQNSEPS